MKGSPVKEIEKNLIIKGEEKLEGIVSQERSGIVPLRGVELKYVGPFKNHSHGGALKGAHNEKLELYCTAPRRFMTNWVVPGGGVESRKSLLHVFTFLSIYAFFFLTYVFFTVVKCTLTKTYHYRYFEVFSSVALSTLTLLYNHHHYAVTELLFIL